MAKSKSHYIRGITPKRVMSGGVHLYGLAPRQHRYEETSQLWRSVGGPVCNLTGLRIETSRAGIARQNQENVIEIQYKCTEIKNL